MSDESIKFRGYRCFSKEWGGFDAIKPINIIIGKNNSGKSCLIDLVKEMITYNPPSGRPSFELLFKNKLNENELRQTFQEGKTGGHLHGDYWNENGLHFLNTPVTWEINIRGEVTNLSFPKDFDYECKHGRQFTEVRLRWIKNLLGNKNTSLSGRIFCRLLADRDIIPESPKTETILLENGEGATNIIRKFITSSSDRFPREIVTKDLRGALNRIFGKDANFTEINVQEHDDARDSQKKGKWEVYLEEEHKGLIPLSHSGSGLKTIILLLLNLLVIPKIGDLSSYIFAFEELENNLHPSLFRRLLSYLEEFTLKNGCLIFITTHSSVILDVFYGHQDAQIIQVEHNGEYATSRTISTHFEHLNVIQDLGAKPSDLLQANGLVWVEGPSDRIYFNKWADIFSDGKLREGRDYQCAYYGGTLLSRYQFKPPEEVEKEKSNLLSVNSNAILIADGDRTSAEGKDSRIKERIIRIRKQIEDLPNGYSWVTVAKEVENYIPSAVLEKIWNKENLPKIGKYEYFCHNPNNENKNKGYLQKHLGKKTFDKVELALMVVPYLDLKTLSGLFDLESEMKKICYRIKEWSNT